MEKITEVEIPATEKRTVAQTTYYCDLCAGSLGKTLYKKNVCDLCERHCHNNVTCGDDHPEDRTYDYPRTLCKICIDLWYRFLIPIQDANEKLEEKIIENIREESLKHE